MANPLTGDFEAVLQVSGSTINRLLASMHQNAGLNPKLPSFPHSVAMRIGDPQPIDGMRGTAWAQVSVPRIDLIHGADDRFNLEVSIRARYKPDPGSTPLPEFIHGTVRAQYRLQNIDPDCWGWGKKAADYLWVRVVGSTVSFDGTAVDDASPFSIAQATDPAADDARITRLVWYLLKNRFEATPQRVEKRFRRGSMRSLNVGVNRSVVAIPLAGQGQLASVTQDLLDGRDFGVGLAAETFLAKIQPELDQLKSDFSYSIRFFHRTTFILDWVTIDITWRITLTQATAHWSGGNFPFIGNVGLITVKIVGQARTQKSQYNWDFDATQLVLITFDGLNEQFVATPLGAPAVNVFGPFGSIVGAHAKPKIAEEVAPRVKTEVDKLAGQLSMKDRKLDLIEQLRKLDETPDAHFDEAVFSQDGVIVRGHIALSPRRPPVGELAKTQEQDGFSGFESWIPGGRIDALEWSWRWFNSWAGVPGTETDTDRFLLRRPGGVVRGQFGVFANLTRPLPVLDGLGTMCLRVRGVQVHPVTGDLVPASSARKCTRSGFDIRVQGVAGHRLFLREWAKPDRDPSGPVQEVSLVDVGGARAAGSAVNTLVVLVGDRWNREVGAMIRDGLGASTRVDAGLLVLVLFRDGALSALGPDAATEISQLAAELEAPLQVNEDVRGSWAHAFSVDARSEGPVWRLITPTGGVSWAHDGALEPRELARVLDGYLFPAGVPGIGQLTTGVTPGMRLGAVALESGLLDDIAHYFDVESPCPPPLVGRPGLDSRAVFAQPASAASHAVLTRMARDLEGADEDRPFVAVILDGASPEEVERLKRELHEDVVVIPDPSGAIAARFGIYAWPTSVTVEQGVVTSVDVGAEIGGRPPDSEAAS